MPTRCEFCKNEIDPGDRTGWHKVAGWRKNTGGANILFPEGPFGHACAQCITERRMGVKPESLF